MNTFDRRAQRRGCRKTFAVTFASLRAMLCHTRIALLASVVLLAGSAAPAGDLVVGLGADNIDHDDVPEATTLHVEYQTDPLVTFGWGGISAMGVLEVDDQSDNYAGVGLSAIWNASARWFVEGSFAAGHYENGSDVLDLGGNLQFRTLLGIGYRLSDRTRVSLALDHLSNGGLDDTNPGRNAVFLRVARSF
jgi:hypothetical protein